MHVLPATGRSRKRHALLSTVERGLASTKKNLLSLLGLVLVALHRDYRALSRERALRRERDRGPTSLYKLQPANPEIRSGAPGASWRAASQRNRASRGRACTVRAYFVAQGLYSSTVATGVARVICGLVVRRPEYRVH